MLDQLNTMLFVTIFKLLVNDIFCNLIGKKNIHSAIDVFSVEGKQHLVFLINRIACYLEHGQWWALANFVNPHCFRFWYQSMPQRQKKYKLRKRILIRSECKMFNFTYSFVK